MSMHVGCKCNVVIATCLQCYLESKFLRCHNVVITTLSQPKGNVVTTLSQRDFVCWEVVYGMCFLFYDDHKSLWNSTSL